VFMILPLCDLFSQIGSLAILGARGIRLCVSRSKVNICWLSMGPGWVRANVDGAARGLPVLLSVGE
jgi:hypothetical protein